LNIYVYKLTETSAGVLMLLSLVRSVVSSFKGMASVFGIKIVACYKSHVPESN
jgi:hypothetical protein